LTRARGLKIAAATAGAILLAVGWASFGPQPLGGEAAYITTTGTSMSPLLHAGDLVVVRRSSSYDIGDVVAYRSASLHVVVLHRIVGRDGDRYLFKGDHNTWVDADHPASTDLVGKMVLRIPGMGGRLMGLRSPQGATALAGLGVFLVVGGRTRKRKRAARHRIRRPNASEAPPGALAGRAPARLIVLSALAAMFVLVGAATFAHSAGAAGPAGIPYDEKGTFTYSAVVPDDAVYQDGRIRAGDPVYLRVTRQVRASFSYRIESGATVTGSGTVGLSARVSDLDGWARTVQIVAPRPFTGARAEVAGTLNLARLQGIITELQRRTSVRRDAYSVTLLPEVNVEATLNGRPLSLAFSPSLSFQLDSLELVLQPSGSGVSADPLAPVRGGLLRVSTTTEARPFAMLGVRLPVGPVRAAAVLGALAALIALAWSFWSGRGEFPAGEAGRIQTRYARWLVPVSAPEGPRGDAVDVATMDDLVRLAGHYDRMILHEARAGAHDYLVEQDARTYRYRVPPGSANGLANGHANGHTNGRARAQHGRRP
jgi:signal peptidase I